MGRMLYVLDQKSGAMLWEHELKGRIKSGFALQDGNLIVLTEPRYVYNFKSEVTDVAAR